MRGADATGGHEEVSAECRVQPVMVGAGGRAGGPDHRGCVALMPLLLRSGGTWVWSRGVRSVMVLVEQLSNGGVGGLPCCWVWLWACSSGHSKQLELCHYKPNKLQPSICGWARGAPLLRLVSVRGYPRADWPISWPGAHCCNLTGLPQPAQSAAMLSTSCGALLPLASYCLGGEWAWCVCVCACVWVCVCVRAHTYAQYRSTSVWVLSVLVPLW